MAFPGVGFQKLSALVFFASSQMFFTLSLRRDLRMCSHQEKQETHTEKKSRRNKKWKVKEIKFTTQVKGKRNFTEENANNCVGSMNPVITERL